MALEQEQKEAPHLRKAQIALAEELTVLVHGEEGLEKAKKITATLFGGDIRSLSAEEIKEGLYDAEKAVIVENSSLTDALVSAGIAKSKREARELISGNSISVNGEKVTDSEFVLNRAMAIDSEMVVIRKGKKNWHVLTFA